MLLENSGWYVRKTSGLPAGVDLSRDIRRDTDPKSIRTVFDVGASVGYMTDYFAQCFQNAQIHCFEPIPETYKVLENRMAQSKRIFTHQLAISNSSRRVRVFLQSDSGLNSLSLGVNTPDEAMRSASVDVQTQSLTTWCRSEGVEKIDLLKIDTEGHDIEVLEGAEEMLANKLVRYILVEATFHSDNKRNTQFSRLNEYLFPYGYKVRGIHDQSTFGNKRYLTCVNSLYLLQNDHA